MEEQGSFLIGLMCGAPLSALLWISFFGWLKLIWHLIL